MRSSDAPPLVRFRYCLTADRKHLIMEIENISASRIPIENLGNLSFFCFPPTATQAGRSSPGAALPSHGVATVRQKREASHPKGSIPAVVSAGKAPLHTAALATPSDRRHSRRKKSNSYGRSSSMEMENGSPLNGSVVYSHGSFRVDRARPHVVSLASTPWDATSPSVSSSSSSVFQSSSSFLRGSNSHPILQEEQEVLPRHSEGGGRASGNHPTGLSASVSPAMPLNMKTISTSPPSSQGDGEVVLFSLRCSYPFPFFFRGIDAVMDDEWTREKQSRSGGEARQTPPGVRVVGPPSSPLRGGSSSGFPSPAMMTATHPSATSWSYPTSNAAMSSLPAVVPVLLSSPSTSSVSPSVCSTGTTISLPLSALSSPKMRGKAARPSAAFASSSPFPSPRERASGHVSSSIFPPAARPQFHMSSPTMPGMSLPLSSCSTASSMSLSISSPLFPFFPLHPSTTMETLEVLSQLQWSKSHSTSMISSLFRRQIIVKEAAAAATAPVLPSPSPSASEFLDPFSWKGGGGGGSEEWGPPSNSRSPSGPESISGMYSVLPGSSPSVPSSGGGPLFSSFSPLTKPLLVPEMLPDGLLHPGEVRRFIVDVDLPSLMLVYPPPPPSAFPLPSSFSPSSLSSSTPRSSVLPTTQFDQPSLPGTHWSTPSKRRDEESSTTTTSWSDSNTSKRISPLDVVREEETPESPLRVSSRSHKGGGKRPGSISATRKRQHPVQEVSKKKVGSTHESHPYTKPKVSTAASGAEKKKKKKKQDNDVVVSLSNTNPTEGVKRGRNLQKEFKRMLAGSTVNSSPCEEGVLSTPGSRIAMTPLSSEGSGFYSMKRVPARAEQEDRQKEKRYTTGQTKKNGEREWSGSTHLCGSLAEQGGARASTEVLSSFSSPSSSPVVVFMLYYQSLGKDSGGSFASSIGSTPIHSPLPTQSLDSSWNSSRRSSNTGASNWMEGSMKRSNSKQRWSIHSTVTTTTSTTPSMTFTARAKRFLGISPRDVHAPTRAVSLAEDWLKREALAFHKWQDGLLQRMLQLDKKNKEEANKSRAFFVASSSSASQAGPCVETGSLPCRRLLPPVLGSRIRWGVPPLACSSSILYSSSFSSWMASLSFLHSFSTDSKVGMFSPPSHERIPAGLLSHSEVGYPWSLVQYFLGDKKTSLPPPPSTGAMEKTKEPMLAVSPERKASTPAAPQEGHGKEASQAEERQVLLKKLQQALGPLRYEDVHSKPISRTAAALFPATASNGVHRGGNGEESGEEKRDPAGPRLLLLPFPPSFFYSAAPGEWSPWSVAHSVSSFSFSSTTSSSSEARPPGWSSLPSFPPPMPSFFSSSFSLSPSERAKPARHTPVDNATPEEWSSTLSSTHREGTLPSSSSASSSPPLPLTTTTAITTPTVPSTGLAMPSETSERGSSFTQTSSPPSTTASASAVEWVRQNGSVPKGMRREEGEGLTLPKIHHCSSTTLDPLSVQQLLSFPSGGPNSPMHSDTREGGSRKDPTLRLPPRTAAVSSSYPSSLPPSPTLVYVSSRHDSCGRGEGAREPRHGGGTQEKKKEKGKLVKVVPHLLPDTRSSASSPPLSVSSAPTANHSAFLFKAPSPLTLPDEVTSEDTEKRSRREDTSNGENVDREESHKKGKCTITAVEVRKGSQRGVPPPGEDVEPKKRVEGKETTEKDIVQPPLPSNIKEGYRNVDAILQSTKQEEVAVRVTGPGLDRVMAQQYPRQGEKKAVEGIEEEEKEEDDDDSVSQRFSAFFYLTASFLMEYIVNFLFPSTVFPKPYGRVCSPSWLDADHRSEEGEEKGKEENGGRGTPSKKRELSPMASQQGWRGNESTEWSSLPITPQQHKKKKKNALPHHPQQFSPSLLGSEYSASLEDIVQQVWEKTLLPTVEKGVIPLLKMVGSGVQFLVPILEPILIPLIRHTAIPLVLCFFLGIIWVLYFADQGRGVELFDYDYYQ